MRPGDLYLTCRRSAHRLEVHQRYVVGEDEPRMRAVLAGTPLPPPGPAKQETIEVLSRLRRQGKLLARVHVVDRPLTDYLRYELVVYRENVDAGEGVRIVDRTSDPRLADLRRDFVVFDGGTEQAQVVWFDYDPDGRLLGYEHSADPSVAAACWRQYRLAESMAASLHEFMTTTGIV
jgi:hypothetical protein